MWTTKRLLLLLAGFTLFFSLYLVYAHFLGGIDGLPPLPPELGPGTTVAGDMPRPTQRINLIDKKVQAAFGPGWEELLKCSIKLEVNSKNLVLLADDYLIMEDGRVKLWPFNVAIFGKENKNEFPEINTVQSKVAYLTFDQPVVNVAEMGNRKIVAGELQGDIKIYNNRRTLARDDDMSLTTPGPLFYDENKRLVWTPAPVDLVDTQRKPEPTIITAVGMELELTPTDAAKPKKKNTNAVTGVDRIRLLSTVAMHMWVDGDSGFLDNSTASKEPAQKKDPAKLVITTEGPFLYEVNIDEAYFEIPKEPNRLGERVKVTRLSGPNHEKHDKLECDKLHIQFVRKSKTAGNNGPDDRALNLTVKNAHATGRQV
ncbi:MAG: hypothetical protein AB7K24_34565, partial [Gemmataceae bacterium]